MRAFAFLLAVLALAPSTGALADDAGPVLRLPGMPAIPLPPGVRAFEPNGVEPPPVARAPAPTPVPAAPPLTAAQAIDELFSRLATAGDDEEAAGVAGAIQRVWMRSGSDTADLLMTRALTAFKGKDTGLAADILAKLAVVDPDWSEVWSLRASLRFTQDDDTGAMADLAHVLALEPRHFVALATTGFILQRHGQAAAALAVLRRALVVYPRQETVRKVVDQLAIDVEGRDL